MTSGATVTGHGPAGEVEVRKVMQAGAMRAMRKGTTQLRKEISTRAPGSLGKAFRARNRRTSFGVEGTVRSSDFRVPMVSGGTGALGTGKHSKKARIQRKDPGARSARNSGRRVALPIRVGGQVFYRASAKGQRPQRFIERGARAAQPRAEALIRAGAVDVARALEEAAR